MNKLFIFICVLVVAAFGMTLLSDITAPEKIVIVILLGFIAIIAYSFYTVLYFDDNPNKKEKFLKDFESSVLDQTNYNNIDLFYSKIKPMNTTEISENIVDAILVKLSTIKSVGDALEALNTDEYDELEDELIRICEKENERD